MAGFPFDGDGLKAAASLAQVQNMQYQVENEMPTTWAEKTGVWLKEGAESLPAGIGHALSEDFGSIGAAAHTLVVDVGGSAAIAAAIKTALPEGGAVTKLTGAVLGTIVAMNSAKPIMHSYRDAQNATNNDELQRAGKELGDASGELITNTGLGMAGWGLGAWGTNKLLASETMDDFAVGKAKFWQPTEKFVADKAPSWVASALMKPEAIQRSRTIDLNTRSWKQMGAKAAFLDSAREQAPGEKIGDIDPNAKFNVSVYAKSVDSTGIKLDRRLARIAKGTAGFVDDAEMQAKFGGDVKSMSAIEDWAKKQGLTVTAQDARTGRMVLNGTGSQFETALGTKLQMWQNIDGTIHRARVGTLNVDSDVAPHIDAILGSDNRPAMAPQKTPFVPITDLSQVAGAAPDSLVAAPEELATRGGQGHAKAPADKSLSPKPIYADDLARARGLDVNAKTGAGKTIGIGELGGDVDLNQDATYYTKRGLPVPERVKYGVNGTVPQSDGPQGADGEVALDTNTAGLVAPGAKQRIIFGPNDDSGFPDVQNEMSFPSDKDAAPADVISWSWGQYQAAWTKQAQAALTNALKRSAAKGITTFVAAGDNGAADGAPKGFDVDFPSASPYVVSVGGTQVILQNGTVAAETAWNDGPRGGQTGGGISNQTPRPDFQKDVKVVKNANNNGFEGMIVPIVSENASPKSGYIVQVDGQQGAIGGTSGAAPVWAAYTAAMASDIGRNFGNINYAFFKNGTTGIFRDITTGDNNGYKSTVGYDPVTGWGTPIFPKMTEMLTNYNPAGDKVTPLANDNNDSGQGKKAG